MEDTELDALHALWREDRYYADATWAQERLQSLLGQVVTNRAKFYVTIAIAKQLTRTGQIEDAVQLVSKLRGPKKDMEGFAIREFVIDAVQRCGVFTGALALLDMGLNDVNDRSPWPLLREKCTRELLKLWIMLKDGNTMEALQEQIATVRQLVGIAPQYRPQVLEILRALKVLGVPLNGLSNVVEEAWKSIALSKLKGSHIADEDLAFLTDEIRSWI